MTQLNRHPLLLTLGDPAGIGPEIAAKAWMALRAHPEYAFAIIAPRRVMIDAMKGLDAAPPWLIAKASDIFDVFSHNLPFIDIACPEVTPGNPTSSAAPAITGSIERAVKMVASDQADAIVTNPIAKHILYDAGFSHPGHTEYLGALTKNIDLPGPRGPVMMLSGGGLRVALATVHLSLVSAAKALNQGVIIRNAQVMNHALQQDFGIAKPRIAMTGLNPHAGEGGALGMEEIEIINPAARALRDQGINITDAQPADTLFHAEAREGYDAVLAMYHDQGLIPVKTLDFHGGVNITLGLPIVRTSPDHGTAFGIAGKGVARADSLIAAIKSARLIADNRRKFRHG